MHTSERRLDAYSYDRVALRVSAWMQVTRAIWPRCNALMLASLRIFLHASEPARHRRSEMIRCTWAGTLSVLLVPRSTGVRMRRA
eukprot:6207481-Pleurochrysis_carterae.AAC.1